MYSSIEDISEKDSYLVPNTDLRGVGVPYVKSGGFLQASLPIDPTVLAGSGITLAAIPSPISGKYIHLPDGNVTAPGLAWQGEVTSGRYRIGLANTGESILGDLVFDWNATRLRLDSGFSLDITDMTPGSVLFAGTGGRVSQDNANLFWDDTNNYLGIGTNAPSYGLEIRSASLSQLALSTDANNGVLFRGNGTGLIVDQYNNSGFAPDYVFRGDSLNGHPTLRIYNTHTSGSTSHAWMIIETGGASAGDPTLVWDVDFATIWAAGIDNSDSDKWKLSFGATLGTNDYLTVTTAGSVGVNTSPSRKLDVLDTTGPQLRLTHTAGSFYADVQVDSGGIMSFNSTAHEWDFFSSTASTDAFLALYNTDNTSATSTATAFIQVGGSTAGDPSLVFEVVGSLDWAVGIDNSDSDKFKISRNLTLGTNDYLTITTAGVVSFTSAAVSGLTSGSVVFAGSSGVLSQNNAAFFWDDASEALCIGTNHAAAAGMIRVPSTFTMRARNNANSLDLLIFATTASDGFTIGSTASVGDIEIVTGGTADITFQPGGVIACAGPLDASGTRDCGANNPFRTIYAGTSFISGATGSTTIAGKYYSFSTGGSYYVSRQTTNSVEGFWGAIDATDGVLFGSATNHAVTFRQNNANAWSINTSKAFLPASTYDIAASGARAGTIYATTVNSTNYTIGSFSTGSIPYIAASSVLSQDNTNLFFDATNKQIKSGSAYIGTWNQVSSSWCFVQNNALSVAAGNYALIQNTSGQTVLNSASGQQLNLRINNTDLVIMTGTTFQLQSNVTGIGFYGHATATQGTGGENVTNSVTNSGSTSGTIPDITDGVTYANDYTNLRRALFQIARMLKQDHDQLRAMGILT